MNDLSTRFMNISAEKGNKYAKDINLSNRTEKIKEFLNNILELISFNLQAEFNRISSSQLGQFNTKEIGKNIREIIEKQLEKMIFLIEKERGTYPQIEEYIPNKLKKLYFELIKDEKIKIIVEELFEMNLFHDFGQITDRLNNLDVATIDLILRYLTIINIIRRISRREILKREPSIKKK